jgi:Sec-independent protein translocase protein TatA
MHLGAFSAWHWLIISVVLMMLIHPPWRRR